MNYKCLKNNNKEKLQPMFDSYEVMDNYGPVHNDSDSISDDKPKKTSFLFNLFNKKKRTKEKNIEGFTCFLGIGDCGSSSTVNNLTKNSSKLNKKVNDSILAENVNKMVNSAMTNAILSNKQQLVAMASAMNQLNIDGVEMGDNATIDMGNQNANSKVTVDNTVSQENIASVSNDFSTQLSSIIDKAVSDVSNLSSNIKDGTNIGATIGAVAGIVGGVANNAISTAGSCFKAVFGGGDHTNTNNTVINEINEEINIDNSIKSHSENDVKNIMETILSAENIANAISNAKADNIQVLKNAKLGNNGKILVGTQEAVAANITKSLVNQLSKINVGNKVLNKIDNVLRAVNNKYLKSNDIKSQNDMADIATGMVGIIAAGGDAAAKTLEAGGEAVAKPITAVGDVFSKMLIPLIIIGVCLVVGLVIWMIIKKQGNKAVNDYTDIDTGADTGNDADDMDSLGDSN